MAKASPAANQEAPPKKKGLMLIIVALVVLLAGGGGAAWFFMKGGDGKPEETKKADVPPVYERLEIFTVNLAGGDHYLQVEISLKIADPKVSEKLKLRMPEIRDAIIRLLTTKDPEELATGEGKEKLSEEVRTQVNKVIGVEKPDEGVLGVLFISFIIQ